jgi:hypothetical protein
VLVYDRALTDAERQTLEGALLEKDAAPMEQRFEAEAARQAAERLRKAKGKDSH